MAIIRPSLLRVIRGYRHRDYTRTVSIADWSESMMTGDNQDVALIKFHTKESKEQRVQRVSVTSSKTQFASEKIAKYFNEVHRSDTVTDELYYQEDKDNKKLTELRRALKHFAEGDTYKGYTDEMFFYWNFYDPNAWTVYDWYINDDGEVCPYDLTVEARHCLDFSILHGIPRYLIIRQPKYYVSKADPVKVEFAYSDPNKVPETKQDPDKIQGFETKYKYTMYGVGFTQEVVILPDNGIFDPAEFADFERMTISIAGKDTQVMVRDLTQDLDFLPAQRVGYFKDPKTKKRTFVNPLYPGTKVYDDLIRNKSEYDLTKTLHGFYQKFQYVERCKPCDGQGYIVSDKGAEVQCKRCKGRGKLSHQTVQDIVEITLPHDPTQIIDLTKLVHYATIPEYLVKMQSEDVDKAVKDIFSVIFNDTLFERSEVTVTATENKLNWRSVYNALHPYASGLVDYYKTGISFISQIVGIDGALVNNYSISRDYNMETVDEVIAQRKLAVEAGTPNVIVKHFDMKILEKQHQNDPLFLDTYRAIERLRPLKDKTPNEVLVITSQLSLTNPLKVQWIYFADIIEDMRMENPKIFALPYEVQRMAFDAATVKYQVKIKEANEEATPIVL